MRWIVYLTWSLWEICRTAFAAHLPAGGEICHTSCATSPAPCRRGPCKLFEAHGLTALGLFPHKALQEQAPDGLVRKKPSAAR